MSKMHLRKVWEENINQDGKGEPAFIFGKVTDTEGNPIKGAEIDVWQANEGQRVFMIFNNLMFNLK